MHIINLEFIIILRIAALDCDVMLNVSMSLVCVSCAAKIYVAVIGFFFCTPAGESQMFQRETLSFCCHTEVSGQEKEVRQEVRAQLCVCDIRCFFGFDQELQ